MSDAIEWPPEAREAVARIIDPEAFGLPSWVPSCGADYLTDRDEARDKADAIFQRFVAQMGAAAFQRGAEAMREKAKIFLVSRNCFVAGDAVGDIPIPEDKP